MPKRDRDPYLPSAEHRRLLPDISGNAVNGLGEEAPRRPRPLFWHDPDRIAHGALQRVIESRYAAHPDLADFHQRYGGRGPGRPAPLAGERAEETPEGWAARLKDVALAHEADLVGIARLDPLWVFEGYAVSDPWIVVLGIAMDHARLSTAPQVAAAVEVVRQYNRGTRAARALANWIRGQGWPAVPHGGPRAGPVSLIPAALACGFGELGKHGSIINRTYGSSFRLAAVTTELPLTADAPDVFAADDFCTRCRVCTDACPPRAISPDKQMVRGARKWYVDFDKCIPYFNDTYGCGICIAVCPWSLPGIAPRLAGKMTRRRARGAQPHD